MKESLEKGVYVDGLREEPAPTAEHVQRVLQVQKQWLSIFSFEVSFIMLSLDERTVRDNYSSIIINNNNKTHTHTHFNCRLGKSIATLGVLK